jgi:hypothetical protein
MKAYNLDDNEQMAFLIYLLGTPPSDRFGYFHFSSVERSAFGTVLIVAPLSAALIVARPLGT